MCGFEPADVLMVNDDPVDVPIAAVGRLARRGAVRYVCGYDLLAGRWVHLQVTKEFESSLTLIL